MPDEEMVDAPAEPTAPEGEGQEEASPSNPPEGQAEEEVNGVKYKLDEEGNYCLGGVPVMDAKKVPYYNRSRELQRKTAETEADWAKKLNSTEERHRQEFAQLESAAGVNDDEIDDKTGLTFGALKEIRKGVMNEIRPEVIRHIGDNQINLQLSMAKNDPRFKSIFKNEAYTKELYMSLAGLGDEARLIPSIVEKAAKQVIGEHADELITAAERRGREAARSTREIVSEVQLGPASGAPQGRRVRITDEMRDLMKGSGLSAESAAEVVEYRENARKQRQKGA